MSVYVWVRVFEFGCTWCFFFFQQQQQQQKKVLFAFAHTLLQCSAPNFFFVVSPVTLNNTCYQRIMTEDGEAVMGKKKVVLFRTMELTGCRAILAS